MEQDQMTQGPTQRGVHSIGIAIASALTGVALVLLAGCAQRGNAQITSLNADLGCVDDSRRCIDARARALRALRADTSRAWLHTPPSAAHYAAGVRLFAMRKDKAALTCAELKRGHAEAQRSPAVLRTPQSRATLTPAQISRGVLLADDVRRDLEREQRKKRCKS